MITAYAQKCTIATPIAHIPDANQLALCLGESSADDQTFSAASYKDLDGNLYAVCSTAAKPVFSIMAGQQLQAHAHAAEMDLAAPTRAQALLQINGGIATPDVIAVIISYRLGIAQDHVEMLGLERIPEKVGLTNVL